MTEGQDPKPAPSSTEGLQSCSNTELWLRFHILRDVILECRLRGYKDTDERILEPRRQQRTVAEEMLRRGLVQKIVFDPPPVDQIVNVKRLHLGVQAVQPVRRQ